MRSKPFRPVAPAYLLWQEEQGHYAPIALTKLKITLFMFLFCIFALSSFALGGYLYFKDDVLSLLVRQHQAQTLVFEDRIAKMRVQMDRASSRQLINQEEFEKKVETLLDKQALMQERQERLAGFGGVPQRATQEEAPRYTKPTPLTSNGSSFFASLFGVVQKSNTLNDKLNSIETSLKTLDQSQMDYVKATQTHYLANNKEIQHVLKGLGVEIAPPQGGPYIPPKNSNARTSFDKSFESLANEKHKNAHFMFSIRALPLSRPLPQTHEITSGFGTRIDPFRGSAALHSGLDFRGNVGDDVRATAAGQVVTASSQGGYGLMVEIEHKNGYTTRYAHLSHIDVREGSNVNAGQVIGRVGSTGRSTGPHLHYEVRKEDEPLDPMRFIHAANRLEALRIR